MPGGSNRYAAEGGWLTGLVGSRREPSPGGRRPLRRRQADGITLSRWGGQTPISTSGGGTNDSMFIIGQAPK